MIRRDGILIDIKRTRPDGGVLSLEVLRTRVHVRTLRRISSLRDEVQQDYEAKDRGLRDISMIQFGVDIKANPTLPGIDIVLLENQSAKEAIADLNSPSKTLIQRLKSPRIEFQNLISEFKINSKIHVVGRGKDQVKVWGTMHGLHPNNYIHMKDEKCIDPDAIGCTPVVGLQGWEQNWRIAPALRESAHEWWVYEQLVQK